MLKYYMHSHTSRLTRYLTFKKRNRFSNSMENRNPFTKRRGKWRQKMISKHLFDVLFLLYAYLHLLVGILIPPSITHIRPSFSLHLLAFSSLHKKCFIWNSMMQKVNRQWFWSVSTDALLKPIHVIKLLFMSQFIEIDVKKNSWYFFKFTLKYWSWEIEKGISGILQI